MQVSVTGANGWIGSATVEDPLRAGHGVVGLVRTTGTVAALEAEAEGVAALLGDLGSLRRGAARADAVAHLCDEDDWADPQESGRAERAAVAAMLEVLEGSDEPSSDEHLGFVAHLSGLAMTGSSACTDHGQLDPHRTAAGGGHPGRGLLGGVR